MSPFWQMITTILVAVISSTGIWQLLQHLTDNHDTKGQLLLGLAHDRIITLGAEYIKRGYITVDEYENLYKYLYQPHEKMGGDGAAKRMMEEVNKLPIREKKEDKDV